MKNNIAFIIKQMASITKHAPVKKELQKTVYLIEKKVDFGRVTSELPTLNDVFLEITGKELRD